MAGAPVLMIAAVPLPAQNQSEALPGIQAGQAFFTDPDNVAALVAAGQATIAPAGTAPPRPLPHSVRGVTGLGAATANSNS